MKSINYIIIIVVLVAIAAGSLAYLGYLGGQGNQETETSTSSTTGGEESSPETTSSVSTTETSTTSTTSNVSVAAGKQGFGIVSPNAVSYSEKLLDICKLLTPLMARTGYAWTEYGGIVPLAVKESRVTTTVATATGIPAPATTTEGSAPEWSSTNIQVEGVDEHDIVKTNGTHIFVAHNGEGGGIVSIVKTWENGNMEIAGRINVTKDIAEIMGPCELKITYGNQTLTIAKGWLRAWVEGLYVRGDKIIVLAIARHQFEWVWWEYGYRHATGEGKTVSWNGMLPPPLIQPTTWVLVYNSNGKLLDHAWISGSLVDSRLAGSKLVVVTRGEPIYRIMLAQIEGGKITNKDLLPRVFTSWGEIPVNATMMASLPPTSYTAVMTLDIDSGDRSAVSVAGAPASFIYMTSDGDVYVLSTTFWPSIVKYLSKIMVENTTTTSTPSIIPVLPREETTVVIRISTSNELVIEKTAFLEGRVTGQFAIDVYKGVLRIALQKGWNEGFNLYTLNATTLDMLGSLKGVAEGERVHGVRFIGDRLYIVTYRTVDPLFTIDLSNPSKPRILGYLKGPGFDEYLHPWNNTVLIGVGYTDEHELRVTTYKVNSDGSVSIISRLVLDKGYTNMFWVHGGYHAFLLDKKHNLILFPATKWVEEHREGKTVMHSERGVYVISVDPSSMKLGLKAFLEHKNAQRELYIKDIIYTISQYKIRSWNAITLEMIGELVLQKEPVYYTVR